MFARTLACVVSVSLLWLAGSALDPAGGCSIAAVRAGEALPADFYVSPEGNDTWSGRLAEPNAHRTDGPLATPAAARDAVRSLKDRGAPGRPIRVLLRGGVYRLDEPVVFGPEDSGTADAPVIYAAYPGEEPVLSGGRPIGPWRKGEGGLWTASVPEVAQGKWYFRSLFVGGRRATVAREPNEDWFFTAGPERPLGDRTAARRDESRKKAFRYQEGQMRQWSNLEDAVLVYYHAWTTSRHRIAEIDRAEKVVRLVNTSVWPMGWWGKDERYFVENVPEALDAPGEWYLDRATGRISYHARQGEDLQQLEVVAPRLRVLLHLAGDAAAGKFVEHLHFEGLRFQHTDWQMPESGVVDGQAAAFLQDATVFCQAARQCVFRGCEIAHTGGYGLWLESGAKDNRVEQCHIHDLGAGGVRIGQNGLPQNPDEQTERNTLHNCFIHDGGNVFHAGVGVWIGKSSHNTVTHNEIRDFYYTGVSVGWSWGYAPSSAHHNRIEYNHIHHLGFGKLSDMGGIYTLGLSPGTRLAGNCIHHVWAFSYGGWGLYTDEGSTGIVMENNIVYKVKDGCFHQHYGRENIVRNNILAYSDRFGQVRRSREEDHLSFTLERNLFYFEGTPLLGGNWTNGNFALDHNCYWRTDGEPLVFPGNRTLEKWQEATGQDRHSIVADPKFVDPENDDYRLQTDSPVFKLGFQPIDPGKIGLVGPEEWKELPRRIPGRPMPFPLE